MYCTVHVYYNTCTCKNNLFQINLKMAINEAFKHTPDISTYSFFVGFTKDINIGGTCTTVL